ncbi:hypothetical protein CANTEDRAFT_112265 [Yamadazyma tenuis ATCC 10573]|uniref:LrgB-domain-containing protein n=1 Tax=Candida tenuis (strain ATCC 10573 / BCRC 21748 / CBS 615 / JCM 9827 / NBRC 10315 / NRRL Y-1498 / VKM Y-70) TaxID=590646 RepID=G3AWI2_CANTC|nr:uncharacterized protein CANTEDRAFT_112265 [Yamadazyma tenuis ATCC 10573]EGV66547.1 hypothetical protein CANTEDRAFT_112265 [Yamadazyma tenuis ATCC 10573]
MLKDILLGITYGVYYSKSHLFRSYVVVPVGVVIEIMILYGLNQFIVNILKITFPASVLGMLINTVILCGLSTATKVHKGFDMVLNRYLRMIEPSMNFSLKWINIFFIPSFIILPLSQPITIIEVLKIAGVFVVGWCALMLINIYSIQLIKILMNLNRKEAAKETTSDDDHDEEFIKNTSEGVSEMAGGDLRQVQTEPYDLGRGHHENLGIGSSSATETENIELMDMDNPFIMRPERSYVKQNSTPISMASEENEFGVETVLPSRMSMKSAPSQVDVPPGSSSSSSKEKNTEIDSTTIFITNYIDWVLYFLLFVASLPLFYTPYHIFLPFHFSVTIFSYFVALLIPHKWPVTKRFAHPILVSTFLILFICFISSLIYHHTAKGFLDDLKYYKTGKNYLNLFSKAYLFDNGETNKNPQESITKYPIWPGCGDFLSSMMDVSIVSLSLPMFTHRRDFIKNFWIMIPILMSIALTFLLYPLICYNIGINPQRSIGFIGRSVTLALGNPLINALEGSISLMAVCTILSGICGVLIGDSLFKFLRVKPGDYVTRGVSLGINCGAIATAHLLDSDPRAASMSSLSFAIFGTVMIVFSSIGEIRNFVHAMVGQ